MKVKKDSQKDQERNGGPPYRTVMLVSDEDESQEIGRYAFSGFTGEELKTYRELASVYAQYLPREIPVSAVDTSTLEQTSTVGYFIEWVPQLFYVDAKLVRSLQSIHSAVLTEERKETVRRALRTHQEGLLALFDTCAEKGVLDCGLIISPDERCILCDYDTDKSGSLENLKQFVRNPDGAFATQQPTRPFVIPQPTRQFGIPQPTRQFGIPQPKSQSSSSLAMSLLKKKGPPPRGLPSLQEEEKKSQGGEEPSQKY